MASASRSSASGGANAAAVAAAAAQPEYWLLKMPNFLHDRLSEIEVARAAPPAGTDVFGQLAAQRAAAAKEPIAELWIRQPKAGEPKNALRQMKLVVSDGGNGMGGASATSFQPAAPLPPLEFPLVAKSNSTMLVFGSEATTLVPAVAAGVDGTRALAAQEAFKLSGKIEMAVDAMPARRDPRYEAAQRERLAAQQAKQHTVMAIKDFNPADPMTAQLGGPPQMQPVALKRKAFVFKAPEKAAKRVRMEQPQLEEAILKLMSNAANSFMTLSAIGNALDQPPSGVSTAARKLLERQEAGPNKGLYGLKPEYRLAGDEDAMQALVSSNTPGPSHPSRAGTAAASAAAAEAGNALASHYPPAATAPNNTHTLSVSQLKREPQL